MVNLVHFIPGFYLVNGPVAKRNRMLDGGAVPDRIGGMERQIQERSGNCTIELLPTGPSFTGVATLIEVYVDENYTAWFGRIELENIVEFGRISANPAQELRITFADGRSGFARIAGMDFSSHGENDVDALPSPDQRAAVRMIDPPMHGGSGALLYFSGTFSLSGT